MNRSSSRVTGSDAVARRKSRHPDHLQLGGSSFRQGLRRPRPLREHRLRPGRLRPPFPACAGRSEPPGSSRAKTVAPGRDHRQSGGVASFISHTSIDCADAYALSSWWRAVLDYREDPDDPNEPGHEECMISSPDGRHRVLFIEVPEAKQVKNRVHFDLRPREGTREQELARLLALGAVQVDDRRNPDGTGWVVLADPEG